VLWKATLGGVGNETGYQLFGAESSQASGLGQATFGESNVVVYKVPVATSNKPNVGLQYDDPTSRPQ
jgi:hypothetical protein